MLATMHDQTLCRAYGRLSKEFYGSDALWEDYADEMQGHWYRIRGDCRLEWAEAMSYVLEGWISGSLVYETAH